MFLNHFGCLDVPDEPFDPRACIQGDGAQELAELIQGQAIMTFSSKSPPQQIIHLFESVADE